MKTLTITDAKKNLSRWLAAASRGEDIGIVYGADIIALRKVDVGSTDHARREYKVTDEQVAALEKATDRTVRETQANWQAGHRHGRATEKADWLSSLPIDWTGSWR